MRTLIIFVATGAYSGYAPFASGTVGTLVAIPLILLSAQLFSFSVALHLIAIVLAIAGACWVAGVADRELGEHDSGKIVIDEFMGFLVATAAMEVTWPQLILAFFLFRLFDIVKPPPASFFDQKVPGGIGVVLDDVCAGLYTNLIVRILL
ncbi:MAG: phosphatidylglycerophosphatase A [Deltaproteobacteria bacterium]|nr:phosphatidylglycerophosphatase A [Deltaproteobacteria bacterium]